MRVARILERRNWWFKQSIDVSENKLRERDGGKGRN